MVVTDVVRYQPEGPTRNRGWDKIRAGLSNSNKENGNGTGQYIAPMPQRGRGEAQAAGSGTLAFRNLSASEPAAGHDRGRAAGRIALWWVHPQ